MQGIGNHWLYKVNCYHSLSIYPITHLSTHWPTYLSLPNYTSVSLHLNSCGLGRHLSSHNTCEDLDECLWSPCLHGGTCYNLRPGYQCVCDPSHAGDNCQWTSISSGGHPLTAPAAIAALTVSLLLLGQWTNSNDFRHTYAFTHHSLGYTKELLFLYIKPSKGFRK